jgi:hypothetical protein
MFEVCNTLLVMLDLELFTLTYPMTRRCSLIAEL